jgi:hypothetical protein
MKAWHLEHAEKAIVRFVVGLSEDASEFEKRNYKKYRTVNGCYAHWPLALIIRR